MSGTNKEQTLFLKELVLFISIDGKEYQVSNQEAFEGAWVPLGVTLKEYFKSFEGTGHPEWPGNVNIVHQIKDSTGWITTHELMYSKFPDDRRRIVARLLPKEKKEDYKQFESKDLHIVTPESSEPQEKRVVCDKCNQPINWKIELTNDEGQVIPAPVESQEERYDKELDQELCWRDIYMNFSDGEGWIAFSNRMKKHFTIIRKP